MRSIKNLNSCIPCTVRIDYRVNIDTNTLTMRKKIYLLLIDSNKKTKMEKLNIATNKCLIRYLNNVYIL